MTSKAGISSNAPLQEQNSAAADIAIILPTDSLACNFDFGIPVIHSSTADKAHVILSDDKPYMGHEHTHPDAGSASTDTSDDDSMLPDYINRFICADRRKKVEYSQRINNDFQASPEQVVGTSGGKRTVHCSNISREHAAIIPGTHAAIIPGTHMTKQHTVSANIGNSKSEQPEYIANVICADKQNKHLPLQSSQEDHGNSGRSLQICSYAQGTAEGHGALKFSKTTTASNDYQENERRSREQNSYVKNEIQHYRSVSDKKEKGRMSGMKSQAATTSEITSTAVETPELSFEGVTTPKMPSDAVTIFEMASSAVTASAVTSDMATTSEMSIDAGSTSEMDTVAITRSEMAPAMVATSGMSPAAVAMSGITSAVTQVSCPQDLPESTSEKTKSRAIGKSRHSRKGMMKQEGTKERGDPSPFSIIHNGPGIGIDKFKNPASRKDRKWKTVTRRQKWRMDYTKR